MNMNLKNGGFCIDCGHKVESFEGLNCCLTI